MPDVGLSDWLKSLPGRRVTRLTFARFVADGFAINLDELGFELDGLPVGKIKCAPDGETLQYLQLECAEVDVGEYGTRKLFETLDGLDVGRITDTSISGVDLISDNSVCIGVVLKFENDSEFVILNCGDELEIAIDDHPALHDPMVTRRAFA